MGCLKNRNGKSSMKNVRTVWFMGQYRNKFQTSWIVKNRGIYIPVSEHHHFSLPKYRLTLAEIELLFNWSLFILWTRWLTCPIFLYLPLRTNYLATAKLAKWSILVVWINIILLILLIVQMQPPRFSMQPSSSNSIVREGTTKILQCSAMGK